MEYRKKRVKLITYIDHKSDLGGECSPQKFNFLSVGGNFEFFGGGNSPLLSSEDFMLKEMKRVFLSENLPL